MWSGYDWGEDKAGRRHTLLVWLASGALVLAAYFLVHGLTTSQWPTAKARVLSVAVKCVMTAEGRRRHQTPASVVIPCSQVQKFQADNAERRWRASEVYSGEVRVMRDGIATVLTTTILSHGGAPRIDDTFEVVQNPDVPSDISIPEASVGEIGVGIFLGGLGIFILICAFFWF